MKEHMANISIPLISKQIELLSFYYRFKMHNFEVQ